MQDIINWLTGEKDYQKGVVILEKYSTNIIMNRNFRMGLPRMYIKKLEFELKVILGIPKEKIFTQKCSNEQLINQYLKSFPVKYPKVIPEKKIQTNKSIEIPEIIRDAKELIVDLWKQISIIHQELYDLGESNSKEIVKKRKILLDKRKPIIEKYDLLYNLKEEYFITKRIPKNLPVILSDNPVVIDEKKKDINSLSDIELIKDKNRLSSKITKQKNKIKYQSVTAQKEENPIPEGPLKKQAEEKLKRMKNLFNQICKTLDKREKC